MKYNLTIMVALLALACSGDVAVEPEADAVFGVGNAVPLVISDFAVDQPVANYLDPLEVAATVQVGHLRGNEYVRVRLTLGPIYVFRDGSSCRDNGYPSGAYCVLAVGLCEVGDSWLTRSLEFDEPGTYEVAIPLEAGALCDGLAVSSADYRIGLVAGVFNRKNDQKYRSILNQFVVFTLVN